METFHTVLSNLTLEYDSESKIALCFHTAPPQIRQIARFDRLNLGQKFILFFEKHSRHSLVGLRLYITTVKMRDIKVLCPQRNTSKNVNIYFCTSPNYVKKKREKYVKKLKQHNSYRYTINGLKSTHYLRPL